MTIKLRWKVNETEGEPVIKDCGLLPIMVRVSHQSHSSEIIICTHTSSLFDVIYVECPLRSWFESTKNQRNSEVTSSLMETNVLSDTLSFLDEIMLSLLYVPHFQIVGHRTPSTQFRFDVYVQIRRAPQTLFITSPTGAPCSDLHGVSRNMSFLLC